METGLDVKLSREPAKRTGIFFKGDVVLPRDINPITESASNYLDSLLERVNFGSKANLIFDIDGVLTEISLETAANPKLLDAWAEENKESIDKFRLRLDRLKSTGDFRVGICTGRGWDYTQRIADLLFSKDSLDYAVVEGEAIVAAKLQEGKTWVWELKPAKSVNKDSLENLNKYRQTIIDYAKNMGAALEPKEIRLTFNPPKELLQKEGPRAGEIFKSQIKEYLGTLAEDNPQDREMLEKISKNITNTPSTVEIMPSGIDKLLSLQEMAGDNVKIYFGDANTDKSAMGISDINVAPANSESDIKNFVKGDKSRGFFGLLSSQNDIKGVNKAIDLIYAHYKRLKRFPPKGRG